VRTAQALRELQHRGRIVMLSDEVRLPYDRPPLSKNYLQGKVDEAQIRLMTPRELEELRIAVRLSQRMRGGLVCDAYGRTQDPRVFGVGDAVCTKIGNHYHPTRQWTAVTEQARRAAGAICGEPDAEPIVEDFYFWSDQHGTRLQFAGQVPPKPRLVWVRGGPHEERFVVLVCDAAQVRAVFSLGSPRELTHSMALRRAEPAALEAP